MKKKDKVDFKKFAKYGIIVGIIITGIYMGIFPFDQARPEARDVAQLAVVIAGAYSIVATGAYLATQNSIFGSKIDGFLTPIGYIVIVAKLVFTGQLL